jgi:hypothetical protein
MNPNTAQGALHFFIFGFGGAIVALVIAQIFPSIIPAQATGVQL